MHLPQADHTVEEDKFIRTHDKVDVDACIFLDGWCEEGVGTLAFSVFYGDGILSCI